MDMAIENRSEIPILHDKEATKIWKDLCKLEEHLKSDKTYENILRTRNAAKALAILRKDVIEIKHKTEDICRACDVRIGLELMKIPKEKGGEHFHKSTGNLKGTSATGLQATGLPRGAQARYKGVAKADKEGKLEKIKKHLRYQGKAVNLTSVHIEYKKQVDTKKYSHQEQINRFIKRLNRFWDVWIDDLEKWMRKNPNMDEKGRKAIIGQLYRTGDMLMQFAQELDGR